MFDKHTRKLENKSIEARKCDFEMEINCQKQYFDFVTIL